MEELDTCRVENLIDNKVTSYHCRNRKESGDWIDEIPNS